MSTAQPYSCEKKSSILGRSASCFNTLGADYKLPKNAPKPKVQVMARMGHGYRKRHPKNGYMDAIVKRAQSCVDCRKYASQDDWNVMSQTIKDTQVFTKSKRVTLADEMLKEKQSVPGPDQYDNSGP